MLAVVDDCEKNGRAIARPNSSTHAVRKIINRMSRMWRIRLLRCRASRRKFIAAHGTTLNRRRLSRWMMIGPLAAASPAQKKIPAPGKKLGIASVSLPALDGFLQAVDPAFLQNRQITVRH